MVVRFKSDHRLVSRGFKAIYSRLVPTTTTPQPPTTPGEIPFWLCLNWKGQRSWWLTEKYIYVRFEGKRKTQEVVNPSLFVRWKQIKTFFKSKLRLFFRRAFRLEFLSATVDVYWDVTQQSLIKVFGIVLVQQKIAPVGVFSNNSATPLNENIRFMMS